MGVRDRGRESGVGGREEPRGLGRGDVVVEVVEHRRDRRDRNLAR